jgi:pimeloyl-ACP methyl ester carboxylesterase
MIRRQFLTLALLLSLVGCVAPIRVHEGPPRHPEPTVIEPATLKQAARIDPTSPQNLGRLLDSLRLAAHSLAKGNRKALEEYNFLTARLVDHLIAAEVRPWDRSLVVRGGSVDYLLRGTEPPGLKDPARTFIPTDRLSFSGRYARDTGRIAGIGAPLVAFLDSLNPDEKTIPYRAVTAVVRFDDQVATIDLHDPYATPRVSLGGRSWPLQADFNAPVAYILSKERIDRLGLIRLIDPVRYKDTARIGLIQAYDPKKIPVLLVHGLQDTPASFAPMYFELMDDPIIRERFQFWAFSYPSGYPYPISAAILRRELNAMREHYPDHQDLVIIGHSMGGLVSRLMVTDVGDRLWRGFFGKQPEETEVRGESRRLLEASLVFDARDEISRAIFIAAPHRGSELASNIIGWIGIKLIRFPATLADLRNTMINVLSTDFSGLELDHFPNSIDTLAPENRFVKRIQDYPIRKDLPYHSIIGDRGRGNSPDSSDGVVAYWSSHLKEATSEKIVPSGHMAHQHEMGIEEVRRILYLHLGAPYEAPSPGPAQGAQIRAACDRNQ